MYVDLRPGVRRNVNAAAWISGVFGSLAGGIGGAIGVKTLAALGALGIVGAGVGAAGAVALGSMALYRGSYRGAVRRAHQELTRALDAVANSLRAEDVFGPRNQLPAAPRNTPGTGTPV
jgi:Flp pilus assembly protein TadB